LLSSARCARLACVIDSNVHDGPLEPSGDGRDASGRFARGNRAGRGNPFAKRVAALRRTVYEAISEDDMRAVVRRIVEMALGGDIHAIREVLPVTEHREFGQ
jgi:hypothetical protein